MKKSFQHIENSQVKICAITGGIGSGKSTVANYYEQKGFQVIRTDNLAKNIMETNSNVINLLKQEFGNEIYINNKLNSKLLSDKVFNSTSPDQLEKLNKIVHPAVIEEMINEIEILINRGETIIFVESALIYEANLEEGFDYIIVIDAKEDLRIQRTAKRMQLSEEEIRIRNREQISTEVKKNLADFVIENNGQVEELLSNAGFILDLIKMA
jgi:dephospho-CoA kinase